MLVLMATAYRYHSIEPEGLWTSEPFPAAERRHIVQGVIAGFLSGRPRWATALDGTFIYGLDAKGKEMKAAPSHHATTRMPHHHATKKSPAQLQREIDEVLAHPGAHSYEEAMAALEKKHAGVPRGGSLRSGHVPVVPKMTSKTKWSPSVLQMLKRHKARVRFEDRSKRFGPSMHEAGLRWTAFVQDAFGHDVVGDGATKEAAARAAVAELPPHIRRHFESL